MNLTWILRVFHKEATKLACQQPHLLIASMLEVDDGVFPDKSLTPSLEFH